MRFSLLPDNTSSMPLTAFLTDTPTKLTYARSCRWPRLRVVNGQTILPDPVMTLQRNVPMQMTVQRVAIAEPHPTHA